MSVSNGQIANATTFNTAFVSRTTDTSTTGKLDLNNSGSTVVVDAQLVINNILVDLANAETDIDNLESSRVFKAASSTDNAIVRFDGTTGQSIQDSLVTISDTGTMIVPEDLTVQGNLTVEGTLTSVNSTNLEVEDQNITVNKNGSDITAEGAGLTVERAGTDGSLVYEDALASKWKAGALGSEVELANVSSTQTFTNKTIVAANNTITTAASGNLTSTELNAALDELQDDIDALGSPADYILKSTVTTKGDLIAATASAAVARLGVGTNGQVLTADSAETTGLKWADSTGGSGGGVKNLITNGNADNSLVTIFVPYADAAASRPVDGTGGSPTVTTTITSTAPLEGTKSYLLTKPASNVQGEGWTVPFTVDPAYRAKVLTINFDYIVNSGTFVAGSPTADSDVIWYIYDVTNSSLIEPSSIKMLASSTTISDRFSASFQSSATGSSYRLIAHVATTSAVAYELKVDNVTVSPSAYVFGTPITDWTSFTPTGSWTTNTTYSGRWRRVGQNMEIQARATLAGAPNAASLLFNIPSGYSIDIATNQTSNRVGYGYALDNGVNSYPVSIIINSATALAPVPYSASATYASNVGITQTVPFTWGNTDFIDFYSTVSIVGWSSSVQTSDQTDTRVVAANVTLSGTQVVSTGTSANILNTTRTIENDTHGAYNTSTGFYTVPVSGFYRTKIRTGVSSAVYANSSSFLALLIKKNNIAIDTIAYYQAPAAQTIPNQEFKGDRILRFNAGETIIVEFSNSSGNSATLSSSYLEFERISGPSAIAANETVSVSAVNSSGQSFANNTQAPITGWTKENDTHNSFSTSGVFTAPVSGLYGAYLSVCVSSTFTANTGGLFAIIVPSVGNAAVGTQAFGNATSEPFASIYHVFRLQAGQTLTTTFAQSNGATRNLFSVDATRIKFSVTRIGN